MKCQQSNPSKKVQTRSKRFNMKLEIAGSPIGLTSQVSTRNAIPFCQLPMKNCNRARRPNTEVNNPISEAAIVVMKAAMPSNNRASIITGVNAIRSKVFIWLVLLNSILRAASEFASADSKVHFDSHSAQVVQFHRVFRRY